MGKVDPTQLFTSRVADYVKYRPSYPPGVVELLKAEMGLSSGVPVADIGAGTGIFTALLVAEGAEVYAVEPNAAMRGAAESALGHLPNFHSIDGTAEETGLPANSIHMVTSAQAWHWFRHEEARAECERILRPQGWLVLIWNDRESKGSPFAEGLEQILRDLAPGYGSVNHTNIAAKDMKSHFAPAEMQTRTFPNVQRLDIESFIGRIFSASYAPKPGQPEHPAFIQALNDLFESTSTNGTVEIRYTTEVFYGQIK